MLDERGNTKPAGALIGLALIRPSLLVRKTAKALGLEVLATLPTIADEIVE
ncbi:MAG: hypothetical protein JO012_17900 [Hyphomicrobiales bacterium]|nr:hypothetical protein [Hyphomicrobiales bacterium]